MRVHTNNAGGVNGGDDERGCTAAISQQDDFIFEIYLRACFTYFFRHPRPVYSRRRLPPARRWGPASLQSRPHTPHRVAAIFTTIAHTAKDEVDAPHVIGIIDIGR